MENTNTQNSAFLSLRHLVKVYPNGEKAVYDFNLDIQKNEFIVIVGPSGCGKSTTMRMVAGLEDVSDGDIYLGDELLNYKPSNERKMAIVFQSYALYPQMNVYENIAFPLTINKYPMPVVNAVLRAQAEILNIIEDVGFAKTAEVLFGIFVGKGKHSEKEEEIATAFSISLDAAKILYKAYKACAQKTLDELLSHEKEFVAAIHAEIDPLAEAELAKIKEQGTVYDDDFNELDGEGNIKTEMRKCTPYEIMTRVYETAEKLDLTPFLDKLPKELSGGQMQRVALGRAIIKNVPVFMMDEPLSNLDAKLRLTMRSEIVRLHNSINATTIYVTHDQTEAMTMASRIVVMSRGFIQQIGTPEDVYNHPANLFVARFIGSPTMNVFDVRLDREKSVLHCDDLEIPVTAEFLARQDAFYEAAVKEYRDLLNNFDQKAKEHILKTLSVTGEAVDKKKENSEKVGFFQKLKNLFVGLKKSREEDPYLKEREICAEKLAQLEACLRDNHTFTMGIRPERIKLEKRETGKEYKNAVLVKPTICELLGSEYNVHFTFCGQNLVGKIDAKDKITLQDEIVVQFSMDDLYVFDPITGNVI